MHQLLARPPARPERPSLDRLRPRGPAGNVVSASLALGVPGFVGRKSQSLQECSTCSRLARSAGWLRGAFDAASGRASRALLTLALLVPAGCLAKDPPPDPAAERRLPRFEAPAPKPGVVYWRAIAFGDFGTGTQDQRRVAEAMVKRVQALQPAKLDVLLSLGDNFYPKGVQSADDPQWQTKLWQVYDHPLLAVPIQATLGNHDHAGKLQAQIDHAQKNPRWRLPARYYAFQWDLGAGASAEVFALDTTPLCWRSGDPKQLAWLEEKLAASRAAWKLVIGHHPIYSDSVRPDNLTLARRLEPLLVKHKVDLYLAGHDHVLGLMKPIQGVLHGVSGAAGGPHNAYAARWTERALYSATGGGFLLLRVSREELVLEFVRMDGQTQFGHVVAKARQGPL